MTRARTTLSVHLAVLAVLAAFTLAAPAAWAQKKAQKAGENIQQFRSSVVAIRGEIDKTLESLNGVVKSANGGDPKSAYKNYNDQIKKMQKQIDKTKSYAQKMKEQGQAYFKDWEEKMGTVTNAELKQRATERRTQLQAQYERISTNTAQAKDNSAKFWRDLQDLDKYYASDLSPKGIAGSADLVTRTSADGASVQGYLDQITAAIDQVLTEMGMAAGK
jgi:septal ring factor EnvC (AmiA/AmiB activator)